MKERFVVWTKDFRVMRIEDHAPTDPGAFIHAITKDGEIVYRPTREQLKQAYDLNWENCKRENSANSN